MQFTKEQKRELSKRSNCLFMDLEDTPLGVESWECLHKPQVWSILETKRIYEKHPFATFPKCSTVTLAVDSGWGRFAIFEDEKLLHIEANGKFTRQLNIRDRDVLVINKEYQNTVRCIWI